jgi:uncharacterized protein YutE (UPF0331/DUF86 family)
MENLETNKNIDTSALTSIHSRYTVSCTPTPEGNSEVDRIMVNQFLKTLAEIAVNIAARRIRDEQSRKPATD